jgi:hypothetical protein
MAMEQMPPAGAPVEGAPAPEGGDDDIITLIGNVGDGLAMLTQVFGAMDPSLGEELTGLSDGVKSVIEKAMAAGGGAPQAGGVSAPETAGAKALPASPAGVAIG